jgi:hypothetical protein
MEACINPNKNVKNYKLTIFSEIVAQHEFGNDGSLHWLVFMMRPYHAASLGRADLILAQAHQKRDIRFVRAQIRRTLYEGGDIYVSRMSLSVNSDITTNALRERRHPRAAYDAFCQQ